MRMSRPLSLATSVALFALFSLLASSACSNVAPSDELTVARRALADAKRSRAPQLAPSALEEARSALEDAERAHVEAPRSDRERALAARAARQATLAVFEATRSARGGHGTALSLDGILEPR